MTDNVLSYAKIEVSRCRRSIDRGGDRVFWKDRLESAAKKLETAAAFLRMQITAIESVVDEGTGKDTGA